MPKKKKTTFAEWEKRTGEYLMNHNQYCDKCGKFVKCGTGMHVVYDPRPDAEQFDDPDFMYSPANMRAYCEECSMAYYGIAPRAKEA